jgi:pimeloyl-ACP methyl ester carboxylesterase
VASAADRLLPSLEESRRLVSAIPDARRVVLPTSGHTALLESGVSLAAIMARTGFLPAPQARAKTGSPLPCDA